MAGSLNKRIIAVGRGYIGQSFERIAGVKCYSRSEIDYTDPVDFGSIAADADVVINCAGFTGRPNIDECEFKRRETLEANLVMPAMMSRICGEMGVRFVHISSGCIYQGDRNYFEGEKPADELSFYSRSKALAEELVDGLIIRIRMPFDGSGHPRCLLTKLSGYPKLIEYKNSLTYVPDMVAATLALINGVAADGIYNVVNDGAVTHREIAEIMGWQKEFVPIEQIPIITSRSNCTLSNDKISRFYRMPSVRQRLEMCATAKELAA